MTSLAATLTLSNRIVGWPCGYAVRERRVVDDRDAGSVCGHGEQRRQPVIAIDHVGHHDDDGSNRAVGDEPLLTADHVTAVVSAVTATVVMPDGSDPASASVTAYASCSSPRSAGRSQRSISSGLADFQTL